MRGRTEANMSDLAGGPWRNPCPVCGAKQPPCLPACGFHPPDEDLDLPEDHMTTTPPAPQVVCSAGIQVIRIDYSTPGHPRNVHADESLCDHLGSVAIAAAVPAAAAGRDPGGTQ